MLKGDQTEGSDKDVVAVFIYYRKIFVYGMSDKALSNNCVLKRQKFHMLTNYDLCADKKHNACLLNTLW